MTADAEAEGRTGLVGHLNSLVRQEDRAALAELRRGVGSFPDGIPRMARYVERFVPDGAPLRVQDAYYLVAGLFAMHQKDRRSERGRYNLGASFRRVRNETDSDSIDKRFLALLDAAPEDAHVHLRHAFSLMKSRDIDVDYEQLLRDLRWWSSEGRNVQRAWARAYWGSDGGSPRDDDDTTTASSRNTSPTGGN
jgi:CRISPR system Cascade subunit CasB